MDLGLEHIVSAKTERFEMGVDYIDSFIEFQNSCESFGEFLNYGKNLIVAFENVSDICTVIKKYGVTESLVSLVGSNFISMEDNSPRPQDAEDDDPGDTGFSAQKKEDAEKVGSGASEAKESLWKKIVAWFKNLFERFMNWFNSFTTMFDKARRNIKMLKDPEKEFKYKNVDGNEKTVAAGKFSEERNKIDKELFEIKKTCDGLKKQIEDKKKEYSEYKKDLTDEELKLKRDRIAELRKELNQTYGLARQQIALASAFCAAANKAGKGGEAKEEKPAEGEEKK